MPPSSPARRLLVCPPRHLPAQDASRHADRALYCAESHTTFSLLPDCLAARLPGTLQELETVVVHAEQATSLLQAAEQVRRDRIELPGAVRWLRRRVRLVQQVLRRVIGLLPQHLAGCRPS